jgi:hypothetical protein
MSRADERTANAAGCSQLGGVSAYNTRPTFGLAARSGDEWAAHRTGAAGIWRGCRSRRGRAQPSGSGAPRRFEGCASLTGARFDQGASMREERLAEFVTLFVVVNPIGALPAFLAVT